MVKKNHAAEGHAAAKRCYKDTVFRMLFADKENLLSLYNAINGKSYTNPDDLEVISVSIFEYDKEEEEKKLRREEFDAGEKVGMEKGLAKGEKIGLEKGEKLGIAKGEKQGIAKGEKYGREKAQKAMLERMLEKGYSGEQIADLMGVSLEQIQILAGKSSVRE